MSVIFSESRVGCVANKYPNSQQSMIALMSRYGITNIKNRHIEDFDIVVVLGGDGFMLRMLHKFAGTHVKIYGVNCGSVGFLLNQNSGSSLWEDIRSARLTELYPIRASFTLLDNTTHNAIAFNEVYVMRSTCQAANVRVLVNGEERVNPLIADGVMLATPVGSTAYNMSAGGVALPLHSGLHAITPICPFRPRRWPGAVVSDASKVEFEVMQPVRREASGFADFLEFHNVIKLTMMQAKEKRAQLLFDTHQTLDDRIYHEQFNNRV